MELLIVGVLVALIAAGYVFTLWWDHKDQDLQYAGLKEDYRKINEASLRELSE